MSDEPTVVILSPTEILPGAIDPKGRVVKTSTLYINDAALLLVVGVQFEDGTNDALTWPLGNRWQGVDGAKHTDLNPGSTA